MDRLITEIRLRIVKNDYKSSNIKLITLRALQCDYGRDIDKIIKNFKRLEVFQVQSDIMHFAPGTDIHNTIDMIFRC